MYSFLIDIKNLLHIYVIVIININISLVHSSINIKNAYSQHIYKCIGFNINKLFTISK